MSDTAPSITGIEDILFGVEDMDNACRFLELYGLKEIARDAAQSIWESLDGSTITLRLKDDATLPAPMIDEPTGRRYTWGVKDQTSLDLISSELSRDRDVHVSEDGLLSSVDDDGHVIAFRITRRRAYEAAPAEINVTGVEGGRPINSRVSFDEPQVARAMGHLVFWSRDPEKSAAFYQERLGFRVTDSVSGNQGILLRAAAHFDHHSIFFLNPGKAPFQNSLQHIEFQFRDMQEVMIGGDRLTKAGFKTVFGPGRHMMGSNWYWYFNTPLGCAFELAADMDRADDGWEPGVWETMDEVKGWSMAYGAFGPTASIEAERRA
ncbi:VOC family protein [Novosphingobium sp. AAP83]|uniref:VOC family protein n=1 Tax=Novosphingobium sp. AAP83 TaxID=1523425 RepID=UPI0006B92D99|nr:VOC family protein [Novosphingobium sp. AAP83]